MAMNFKVFNDVEHVAEYTADIIRKQFNNNPTTIAGIHLTKDAAPVLDELKKDVDHNAVDFSQVNILDYDDNRSYYEALGVPASQIYPINLDDDAESLIDDKIKTKENKGRSGFPLISFSYNLRQIYTIRMHIMSFGIVKYRPGRYAPPPPKLEK